MEKTTELTSASTAMASLVSLPWLSSPKMTIKPLAVLSKSPKMGVPYELKEGQNRLFHRLPSGLNMEVIEQRGFVTGEDRRRREKQNPSLVFVHGSYHAAWCWAEHWLPFFSSSGFDSYALSLLGQGESDEPSGTVAGSLQVPDLQYLSRYVSFSGVSSRVKEVLSAIYLLMLLQ